LFFFISGNFKVYHANVKITLNSAWKELKSKYYFNFFISIFDEESNNNLKILHVPMM